MRPLLALLTLASACSLYTGNGDDTKCAGAGAEPVEVQMLIDPSSNQCETFESGVGGDCGCLPCDIGSGSQTSPGPDDWAECSSTCSALAEAACEATSGCHATYESTPAGTMYWMCDAAAPLTGATAACSTLDALDCSMRDDCTATFLEQDANGPNPTWSFESCGNEVSLMDPGSCTGVIACRSAEPACPPGTIAGIANGCYTGYCIPQSDCGPGEPGSCSTTGITCDVGPPMCPSGTLPGVLDGCWSGYCIPTADCP